jgi:hypothetical protein
MKKRKNRNYWNKKNCYAESIKCTSRSEFKLRYPSAYISARKGKFLNDICLHMIRLGNKKHKCVYSYEFSDKHVYVGLTYNIQNRMMWRKNDNKDAVTEYIDKTGLIPKFKQLTEYIFVDEAIMLEGKYVEEYKNNSWCILNKAKTGGIGGNNLIWTYDKCQTEALKYKFKNEFRINSGSAYNSAQKNKWLNDICSHMEKPKREIFWTFDKCKNEALKYLTKKEFKEKCSVGYSTAVKNKWIDIISEHMYKLPYNIIYWTYDKCLLAAKDCKTKTEFSKKYGGAYHNALRNNWLNEIFK